MISDNNYLNYKEGQLHLSSSKKYESKSNFRIKIYKKSLYIIQHIKSNLFLTAETPNLKLIKKSGNKKEYKEWNIFEVNDNKYIIQNVNKCYIFYKNNNLLCENIKKNQALKFSFLKLYEEVIHSQQDLELIEKEPVDVIIKYIDLRDPDLKRKGIPQIKKDEDNQELKYCIRSILKNIPWIRKIAIVLPNKKVRYFKDYKQINEKIIYINDKNLLGFDSSNVYTFHFNYWRLTKFNISKNIIIMDDDYFIGKPLKKSDFFYVKNGKIVPSLVANIYNYETKDNIINNLNILRVKAKKSKRRQNEKVHMYSIYNTYAFIIKLLKKNSLIVPFFTHNAISCNLDIIKELYNLVYNSEFKVSTLDSIYRDIETLQFQTFYQSYIFNKDYNIKINQIDWAYIDHNNTMTANFNRSLFVINTGGYDYTTISFKKARIAMEKIFPEPTPYEIYNYSFYPSFVFDIVYELDKELKDCKNKIKEYEKPLSEVKKEKKKIKKQKEMEKKMFKMSKINGIQISLFLAITLKLSKSFLKKYFSN